jgi:hypothetical protein
MYVDGGADPTSRAYELGRRQIEEILEIESILAQMQTADAQRALADAQREVAEAQRQSTSSSERERAWNEGRDFWLRRFFTSVAVANGAGAFASITAMLRPDPPAVTTDQAAWIIACFVGGVLIAGAVPLILAVHPQIRFDGQRWRPAQWATVLLTSLAAALLVIGSGLVLSVGFQTLEQNRSALAQPSQ